LIGGVTLDEMIPKVEKYFGYMERAPEPRRYQGREPLPSAENRLTWRSDTFAPRVEVRYQIPGVGHPDRPAFDVLAEAFEAHLQAVVTADGIDGSVDINTLVVHTERFGVPASLNIELVLAGAAQIEKAERTLLGELRKLGEEPLSANQVTYAQKKLRTAWYRTAVDPGALAFELGHFEVMDSWRTLKPYLEARDAATADDLRDLAGKYFVTNNRSVGVVLPEAVPQ